MFFCPQPHNVHNWARFAPGVIIFQPIVKSGHNSAPLCCFGNVILQQGTFFPAAIVSGCKTWPCVQQRIRYYNLESKEGMGQGARAGEKFWPIKQSKRAAILHEMNICWMFKKYRRFIEACYLFKVFFKMHLNTFAPKMQQLPTAFRSSILTSDNILQPIISQKPFLIDTFFDLTLVLSIINDRIS